MATLHGKNGTIYLQGSDSAAVVISEAAEWSIDTDYDLEPDNAMGDTWATALRGISKWSGSMSGNYDTASTVAWHASQATSARKIYIYPDRSSATAYYYGTVWPKLSVKGGLSGKATFDGSFTGDGQLAFN